MLTATERILEVKNFQSVAGFVDGTGTQFKRIHYWLVRVWNEDWVNPAYWSETRNRGCQQIRWLNHNILLRYNVQTQWLDIADVLKLQDPSSSCVSSYHLVPICFTRLFFFFSVQQTPHLTPRATVCLAWPWQDRCHWSPLSYYKVAKCSFHSVLLCVGISSYLVPLLATSRIQVWICLWSLGNVSDVIHWSLSKQFCHVGRMEVVFT